MIAKNLVVKIQNLVVNHESQPVKPNPVLFQEITILTEQSKEKKSDYEFYEL